ncbi:hypothetical protein R3P38DRAFT_2767535 [Favolaschia claudopus]|uniref:Uncharacterized protein n=1 Tax=Favolaschia claudopus TaxID=2862362 RepID=A0AAW0C5P5_9AGAR
MSSPSLRLPPSLAPSQQQQQNAVLLSNYRPYQPLSQHQSRPLLLLQPSARFQVLSSSSVCYLRPVGRNKSKCWSESRARAYAIKGIHIFYGFNSLPNAASTTNLTLTFNSHFGDFVRAFLTDQPALIHSHEMHMSTVCASLVRFNTAVINDNCPIPLTKRFQLTLQTRTWVDFGADAGIPGCDLCD